MYGIFMSNISMEYFYGIFLPNISVEYFCRIFLKNISMDYSLLLKKKYLYLYRIFIAYISLKFMPI